MNRACQASAIIPRAFIQSTILSLGIIYIIMLSHTYTNTHTNIHTYAHTYIIIYLHAYTNTNTHTHNKIYGVTIKIIFVSWLHIHNDFVKF